MPDHFFTSITSSKKPAAFAQLPRESTRRTEHGSSAWLLRDGDSKQQPQDGDTRSLAAELHTMQRRALVKPHAAHNPSAVSVLLSEPEDARLTGGTRSLMRRALGLNVPGTARRTTETLRPVRVA